MIFVINIVITGTDIIKFQKDGLMHKTENLMVIWPYHRNGK